MPVSTDTTSELLRELFLLARLAKNASGREPVAGVHLGGLLLLGAVEQAGESRCSGLAETLGLDVSVISRQLSLLEGQGLTTRHPDPRDGRAWLATLTADGRAVLAEVREKRSRAFNEALADWDETEARDLLKTLHRLEAALSGMAHDQTERKVRS